VGEGLTLKWPQDVLPHTRHSDALMAAHTRTMRGRDTTSSSHTWVTIRRTLRAVSDANPGALPCVRERREPSGGG
jgi:hypothetical protein